MVWIFVAALVLADATAAMWAERTLTTQPVRVTDWFYLAFYLNHRPLFGTLSVEGVRPLYPLIAGAGGIWFVWFLVTSRQRVVRIGCALVLAGLIGNVSSMMMGAVPDYFGVGPVVGDLWLFFNVSDVAIVAGVLTFAGTVVRAKFSDRTR